MGFSSQSGQMVLKTQATPGTYDPATGTSTNEVQTATPSGTWTSGTYDTVIHGESLAAVPYDATAVDLKALWVAAGGTTGDLTITGGPLSTATPFVFTFAGAAAATDIAAITFDTASVAGGGTVAVVETTKGSTGGVGIYYKGGTLEANRELLITDPEIGGGRDVVDAYLGAIAFSGDIEFYPRQEMLQTLLRACLGTADIGTLADGFTTNSFTPVDSGTLPFLSIEEQVGGSLEVFRYTDAVVNTLHLEAEANGYLMGTAGLIARIQTAGHTATLPANVNFDDSPLYVGTNIGLTLNAVALPAKSFSLDINNQFEDDDFRLGSFFLGDLTAKRREITAGFKIRESGIALWRQATYGVSSATGPGGLTTKVPLVITIDSYEAIPGSTPDTTKYQIKLTFEDVILEPYALAISGDDIIDSDLTVRAVRPAVGTPALTVDVRTDIVSIS